MGMLSTNAGSSGRSSTSALAAGVGIGLGVVGLAYAIHVSGKRCKTQIGIRPENEKLKTCGEAASGDTISLADCQTVGSEAPSGIAGSGDASGNNIFLSDTQVSSSGNDGNPSAVVDDEPLGEKPAGEEPDAKGKSQ